MFPVDGTPGSPASASADSDGRFALQLPAGPYVLRVEKKNFAELTERIDVADGDSAVHPFTLRIAGVHDSITVYAPKGYTVPAISSATKTETPLRDVPQSVSVVTHELIQDRLMTSIGDVVRYVPGVMQHQGENNRDQVIMRGNSSSADFFLDGVRDDVQYYRDLYNLERVEALKGPNALMFGRGGAGGVINRVTKEAGFAPLREIDMQGGVFGNKRVAADLDQPISNTVAVRLNAIHESSGSFRNDVSLTRSGIAPSLTFKPSDDTKITVGYENFHDARTADRGISSYKGQPADVDVSTFYGNPDDSHVRARVNILSANVEHRAGRFTMHNRTLIGNYDRSYQNFVPGAVTADKARVTLTAYNNATQRRNLFNQTDVTGTVATGSIRNTLLAGTEFGRQLTDNFRNTGFFNNATTSILVPYASPTISTPVTFRQSATDAENHLRTSVGAVYAQDQIELSPHLQVVGGLRLDRFDLRYHNNRNGDTLGRVDNLVSPRAGIVVKPVTALSLYGSYSVSYLPSSGDQFSSLTTITQQVKPEKFNNYELGMKWDAARDLSLTAAVYRLDRTNTRATDPNDPTRIVQTGSQRTNGYELGINGQLTSAWSIAGGYAHQDAFVTSATTAARAGAQVAQVPHHMLSLWNNVRFNERTGAALGVVYRSAMFAAIDNSVTLPGFTEVEAAAYLTLTHDLRLQLNVDNLFDTKYFANADSNTNISPGSPRAARIGIVARF
ncbi:MAG: catecholate siderophore receptor [Thermoanaerobaculia bacterium]|nr:catecholate siderophore receptor [Thermoanaerobaculia bacterium]